MGLFDRFDKDALKANLKMAITRMNMLKNKMAQGVKLQKKQISDLLQNQKDESARIKVENIIRDDYMMESFEILEILCELLAARILLIAESKTCPNDLKEAVHTIIYAASHMEIKEFQEARKQFQLKYGKEFVQAASENKDLCVNQRVLFKLSIRVPEPYLCVQYLKEIAKEFNVDWDDSVMTNELASLGTNIAMNLNPHSSGLSVSQTQPTPYTGDQYAPLGFNSQQTTFAHQQQPVSPHQQVPSFGQAPPSFGQTSPSFGQTTSSFGQPFGQPHQPSTTSLGLSTASPQQNNYTPMYATGSATTQGYAVEGFAPQGFDTNQYAKLPDSTATSTNLSFPSYDTTSSTTATTTTAEHSDAPNPSYDFDELQKRFEALKRRE